MAELLPHQTVGADFLAARNRALLADEMRVGKTPTAIRACDLVGAQSVLVLCPSIARQNWLREFRRFSTRDGAAMTSSKSEAHPALTVCSYDLLIRQPIYRQLARVWDVVILDECHLLKSDPAVAKRSDAAWKIAAAAKHTWALSGTPAPNHAGELYQLLRNFRAVGCSYYQFLDFYAVTTLDGKVVGNKNVEALRKLLAPIVLRRKLAEVAPDMPALSFNVQAVEPGEIPEELFTDAAQGALGENTTRAQARDAAQTQAELLAERLAQAKDELDAIDPRDSLWFRRLCGLQKIAPSVEIVRDHVQAGAQIVVFAWHRDVLEAVARQTGGRVLLGGTRDAERQEIIQQFRAGTLNVVCAQILAAGTAIDLSAADDVLFVELDWTPGNNAQAAMRVVSQFKRRPVRARFLSVADSIDESIVGALARKTRMLAEIFS